MQTDNNNNSKIVGFGCEACIPNFIQSAVNSLELKYPIQYGIVSKTMLQHFGKSRFNVDQS
jgi:hypothetical protein